MDRDIVNDRESTDSQRHSSGMYTGRRAFLGTVGTLTGIAATGIGSVSAEPTGGQEADQQTIPTYPYQPHSVAPLDPHPHPEVDNPVLTGEDITDLNASFVADPFMFPGSGSGDWHMFFETLGAETYGVISHATSSDGGLSWEYDQVVLDPGAHCSYPYIFKWEGDYYMTIHENTDVGLSSIPLYQAESFPTEWTKISNIVNGTGYDTGDRVLFRWEDRWWCINDSTPDGGDVYAYYSDTLPSEPLESHNWTPHENNPIITGRPEAGRPGSRPIVREDDILISYQDVVEVYGHRLWGYQITELTPSTFSEERCPPDKPLLEPTGEEDEEGNPAWNAQRMHHYDPWYLGDGEGWLCAVDGHDGGEREWSIGIYTVPES